MFLTSQNKTCLFELDDAGTYASNVHVTAAKKSQDDDTIPGPGSSLQTEIRTRDAYAKNDSLATPVMLGTTASGAEASGVSLKVGQVSEV